MQHLVSSRAPLTTLCLFAGLTAIWGGLELVWRPDGSLIRLPLSLLERSPFHDFLVPGLLLAGVVGGINTLAGILVLRRHPRGDAEAIVSGTILATWILVEVTIIRRVHWLHGVYLSLGLAITTLGMWRERRRGTLGETMRALILVITYGFIAWVICAGTMALLLSTTSLGVAFLLHALAAPLVFAAASASYFRRPGAWGPFRAASVLTALAALFDLVIVATFIQRSLVMFRSFVGTWLPFALIFASTWVTGTLLRRVGNRPVPRVATTGCA
jgi:hypothetical protein